MAIIQQRAGRTVELLAKLEDGERGGKPVVDQSRKGVWVAPPAGLVKVNVNASISVEVAWVKAWLAGMKKVGSCLLGLGGFGHGGQQG